MDGGAGPDGGGGEAAGIGEWLDRAGALVQQSAGVGFRPHPPRGLRRIQEMHRRAARLPLPGALLKRPQAAAADSAMQRAPALRFAVNPVAFDEGKNRVWRVA